MINSIKLIGLAFFLVALIGCVKAPTKDQPVKATKVILVQASVLQQQIKL